MTKLKEEEPDLKTKIINTVKLWQEEKSKNK